MENKLLDLGEKRIEAMDADGVDIQVLSLSPPGVQAFEPEEGTAWSKKVNDDLAKVVKEHPDINLLLEGCDCVASLCSTVMLDALLYHKPVWHFHGDGWPVLATNWQEGLAQRVASSAHLTARIAGLLQERECCDRGLPPSSNVFANHGRATQAIADFLIGERQAGNTA